MKKILLLALLIFAKNIYSQSQTITIKGNIVNHEENSLSMLNYTTENIEFDKNPHNLELDSNKNFSYTFKADKPAYYYISRNYLYLSPGDNLEITLNSDDRAEATFKGKGAEANNYLSSLPYPKGGSFWSDISYQNNTFLKEKISNFTYKNVVPLYDSIVDHRKNILNELKNTSTEFKTLEKRRLEFEYINSLQSVYYVYMYKEGMSNEKMKENIDLAREYYKPLIKSKLKDYNYIDNLQLEVFYNVLYQLNDEKFIKDYELGEGLTKELEEYILVNDLMNELKSNYTSNFEIKHQKAIQELTKTKYGNIISSNLEKYSKIKTGKTAIDVEFTNLDNEKIKLSNYKGKLIVLDLWATWCGPCLKEKPYFENLLEKYGQENIAFLSVSIDKKSVWKDYFINQKVKNIELHINRSDLSDYQIEGIPRFFVIDKNFKIVDVYAPVPSSGELETLIKNNL